MSEGDYAEFFKNYPELYSSFHRIVNHAENFYQELQSRNFLNPNIHSLLSIGSGEGELEIKAATDHRIKIGLIEPNPVFMQKFNARLKNENIEKLCAEAFQGKFEDYPFQTPYDLVIAIHSWYAFGLSREALTKALSCLRPGAKLFIALASESSLVPAIASLAKNETGGDLNSERLSTWAKAEGFDHEYFHNQRKIPAEIIFQPNGDLTDVGKNFLSFPTFKPWNDLDESIQKSIVHLVRQSIVGSEIILNNGCLVFTASSNLNRIE